MHIAVCDDNIADRKQTERLLGRESDRRAKVSEGLYIDSYGNETSLLSKPMQYDIFYIDMCQTAGINGADIANKLCALGVRVPIYMCCSDLDYRQFDLPDNVYYLDKPLKADLLTASLDHACEVRQHAIPLIELRDEKETYYVTEADILYAVEEGRHTNVTLTDGRKIRLATNAANLFDQWSNFDVFLAPTLKSIINGRYLAKIGLLQLQMTDGTKFMLNGNCRSYAKTLLERYSSTPSQ